MKSRFIPTSYKNQWSKLMFTFFDYLPIRYEATKREWEVRKLIWDFKDGKRSVPVAQLIARKMREQFGAQVSELTFVCIPASSTEKNEKRYREFAAEVARLTGCQNAFSAVRVEGERLAIHEYKCNKTVQNTSVITFDEEFFKGKKCLVFDDVVTQGFSYARFAVQLEKFGADVIGGYFLGKTILGYNY